MFESRSLSPFRIYVRPHIVINIPLRGGIGEITRRFSEANQEIQIEREVTTNRFLRRRLSIFPDERVKVPSPRLRPLVTATFSPGRLPIVVVVVAVRARIGTFSQTPISR